jgi:4-diphosphocytidyl-2-C-methyl-D-erythritol kinase
VALADGTEPRCEMHLSGIAIEGNPQCNLVVRAYELLSADHTLPPVRATLVKHIPTQAGMGGGSSDGASMLMLLNDMCQLGLSQQQLIDYARRLGADCPYFILDGAPAYAEGIGERLLPITLDLSQYAIAVVKPPVAVSTREAFSRVVPRRPATSCLEVVTLHPVSDWPQLLVNDFEQSVFDLHPELGQLKQRLYDEGAAYAAMSGSGSALFALFRLWQDGKRLIDTDTLEARLHSAMPASCQLFIVSAAS